MWLASPRRLHLVLNVLACPTLRALARGNEFDAAARAAARVAARTAAPEGQTHSPALAQPPLVQQPTRLRGAEARAAARFATQATELVPADNHGGMHNGMLHNGDLAQHTQRVAAQRVTSLCEVTSAMRSPALRGAAARAAARAAAAEGRVGRVQAQQQPLAASAAPPPPPVAPLPAASSPAGRAPVFDAAAAKAAAAANREGSNILRESWGQPMASSRAASSPAGRAPVFDAAVAKAAAAAKQEKPHILRESWGQTSMASQQSLPPPTYHRTQSLSQLPSATQQSPPRPRPPPPSPPPELDVPTWSEGAPKDESLVHKPTTLRGAEARAAARVAPQAAGTEPSAVQGPALYGAAARAAARAEANVLLRDAPARTHDAVSQAGAIWQAESRAAPDALSLPGEASVVHVLTEFVQSDYARQACEHCNVSLTECEEVWGMFESARLVDGKLIVKLKRSFDQSTVALLEQLARHIRSRMPQVKRLQHDHGPMTRTIVIGTGPPV